MAQRGERRKIAGAFRNRAFRSGRLKPGFLMTGVFPSALINDGWWFILLWSFNIAIENHLV